MKTQSVRLMLCVWLVLLAMTSGAQAQDAGGYPFKESGQFELDDVIHDATATGFGSVIVLAGDKGLWTIQYSDNIEPRLIPTDVPVMQVYPMVRSPQVVAVLADNTVVLWNAVNGERDGVFSGHTDTITSFACCEPYVDQDWLFATGSADKTVRVWSALEQTAEVFEASAEVTSVALLRVAEYSYSLLAIGTSDGQVELWSLFEQRRLGIVGGKGAPVTSLAFGRRQEDALKLVIGRSDGSITLWTTPGVHLFEYEGKEYPVYDVPLEAGLRPLALVKPGRRASQFVDPANPEAGLIEWSGNWRGLPVSLTAGEDWQAGATFSGHTDAIIRVDFVDLSADLLLISTGADETLRVWDIPEGTAVVTPYPSDSKVVFGPPDANAVVAYIGADDELHWKQVVLETEYAPMIKVPEATKFVVYVGPWLMATITEQGSVTLWASVV